MPITTLDDLNRNPFIQGELYEVTLGPTGQAEIPRYVSGVMVVGSEHPVVVGVKYARQGKTLLTFTPQWELIERHDVKVTGQSFDFESTLNSDDDHNYRIVGYWERTGSSSPLTLRFNGATTSASTGDEGTSFIHESAGSGNLDGMVLVDPVSASGEIFLDSTLRFKTSEHKLMFCNSIDTSSVLNTNTFVALTGAKWENSSTTITSLGLDAITSGALVAGSWFELYRKPEFDNTKIKIWVF